MIYTFENRHDGNNYSAKRASERLNPVGIDRRFLVKSEIIAMSSVDIIVPCYRYGRFLRECVESVLTQSPKRYAFIDRHRAVWLVATQCRALNLSASAVSSAPSGGRGHVPAYVYEENK